MPSPEPEDHITVRLFKAAGCDVIDMSPGQTTRTAGSQGRQVDRPQSYLIGRGQFHREIFK